MPGNPLEIQQSLNFAGPTKKILYVKGTPGATAPAPALPAAPAARAVPSGPKPASEEHIMTECDDGRTVTPGACKAP
jgi:hypothetical protein